MATLQLRSRQLDYLQLQWLEKTTGISATKWDIYVIKELVDNALDADEAVGLDPIEIRVNVRYARNEERDLFSLEIDVGNQTPFPLNQVKDIFDLNYYASSKSGLNVPTRGKQGNALKTIAGIPYALRHFHYGDYQVQRWPIIIEPRGGERCMVAYHIDEAKEEIEVEVKKDGVRSHDKYNWLRVGIDRFVQSSPRSITDLLELARSMTFFNPHVYFKWSVKIGENSESWDFPGCKKWLGRFSGTAPISWYDVGQFRSLLVSQVRSQPEMSIQELVASFPEFSKTNVKPICKRLSNSTPRELLTSTHLVQSLYDEMIAVEELLPQRITVADLGGVGETSMVQNVTDFFGAPQQTTYKRLMSQDPLRPSCPFVLEVFGARFEGPLKRTIFTGINHTNNYDDPFSRTALVPFNRESNAAVRGLREFVETFGVSGTIPFVLIVHLICPNLRYQDFSKTFIDASPFREKLEQSLSEVLDELTRGKEQAERERAATIRTDIKKLIPQAIQYLSPGGEAYFSLDQLVLAVRQLYMNKIGAATGEKLDGIEIREAVEDYIRENPGALSGLLRRREVQVYIPGHSVTTDVTSITSTTLGKACVNKVLIFSDAKMCEVFVANGLHRRFDVAVIALDGTSNLFINLLRTIAKWEVPLLLAHDATVSGCSWDKQLREYLRYRKISLQMYDLGLTPAQGKSLKLASEITALSDEDRQKKHPALSDWEHQFLVEGRTYRLLALSPQLLKVWLESQLGLLEITEKMVPPAEMSRTIAQKTFRMAVEKWVIEQIGKDVGIDLVIDCVVNAVRTDWKVEDLVNKTSFASEKHKTQSWYELLEDLVSTESLSRLEHRERELSNLVRKKGRIAK
jgi:hypothetical protein